uniref:Uncharacterized protein n=1 Tax=Meleagris gallopavo TaxID=9103 RepID=A0A803XQN1_MELGA
MPFAFPRVNAFSRGYSLGLGSVFADSSTDVDIFFLHWVKTPSIGFHSSFVTSLLSGGGGYPFFFPSSFLPEELTLLSEESSARSLIMFPALSQCCGAIVVSSR